MPGLVFLDRQVVDEDVIPLLRDFGETGRIEAVPVDVRQVNRIGSCDPGAALYELERGGTAQQEGDLELRVGVVESLGKLQRLDGMPDRVVVDVVEQQRVGLAQVGPLGTQE